MHFMRLALILSSFIWIALWIIVVNGFRVVWSTRMLILLNALTLIISRIPNWLLFVNIFESAIISFLIGCTMHSLMRLESFLFMLLAEQVLNRQPVIGEVSTSFVPSSMFQQQQHSYSSMQSGRSSNGSSSLIFSGTNQYDYESIICIVGVLAVSYCSVFDWNEPWQAFPNPQITTLLLLKSGCLVAKRVYFFAMHPI